MSCRLNSSRPRFGVQFLCYAGNTCVVCLRSEDLVLLLSVRLAPVSNFDNNEFLSVITDNQINQLSYILCLLLVILSFMYF